jgi:hypothetical protein
VALEGAQELDISLAASGRPQAIPPEYARYSLPSQFALTFEDELDCFFQVFLNLFHCLSLTECAGNGIHPADVPFVAFLNRGFKGPFHTYVFPLHKYIAAAGAISPGSKHLKSKLEAIAPHLWSP